MEFYAVCSIFVMLGFVGYVLQFFAVHSAARESGKNCNMTDPVAGNFRPPVTILKPLKGLDDSLFDNLASFCQLDYPQYEIIFTLQDNNDPAFRIASKIRDKYSHLDITIHVERSAFGLNPKVNNLAPAYARAKHPYVLISDSNVLVERNYLTVIAQHMADPGVGIVSNMIRGTGGRSWGAIFENLHLNSFIVGSVCMLDRILKMPCVIGKSMLMRRTDLEAVGGLSAVRDVLAEDYVIGKRMHDAGKKVVLSTHLINNVNEFWSMKKFLNRHTRWGKLRWKIGGLRYVSELIGNPVFVSCLPIVFWTANEITVLTAALVGSMKILGDYLLARSIDCDMKPSRYLLVPVKDFIIGCIWFIPLLSQTVIWRGNRYLIGKDSCLSPCSESAFGVFTQRLTQSLRDRLAWAWRE
ncbi:MAG: ceramide glucosyltransferase [Nitrospirae bacterium]|nr:MAG: ceramide glucosyltransferase [Nitrospirota bacterium]